MDETLERDLRRMLDERAIHRLIMSYGRAIDRADREALAAIFHADAVEHHGTFEGPSSQYVDYAIDVALPRYHTTMHYLVNCIIEVDGDDATAESYTLAAHLRDDDNGQTHVDWMSGRFLDRLQRRDGEWRIVERTVVHDWDKTEAIEKLAKWQGVFTRGCRGAGDPVYSLAPSPAGVR